jgi:hypothetical protein
VNRRIGRGVALLALFAAGALLGWLLTSLLGPLVPARAPDPSSRPTPHALAPFELVVTRDGSTTTLTISSDGDCAQLLPSRTLFDVCSLAVNADPGVIGGAALGRLNLEHTAAFDALVWRARASGDEGVCAAGGLEGNLLDACRTSALEPEYRMVDGDAQVEIPSE